MNNDLKTYLDGVPMTTPEMIARVATANLRIELEELREKLLSTQEVLTALLPHMDEAVELVEAMGHSSHARLREAYDIANMHLSPKTCGNCSHYYNDDLCGKQVPADTEAPQCFTPLKTDKKETT